MRPFADRVLDAIDEKGSALVVGVDPTVERLPSTLLQEAEVAGGTRLDIIERALTRFGVDLVRATAPYAVAIKPQLAFFEIYGSQGMRALERIIQEARAEGLLVIADGKRNDIGSTAEGYATAYLGGEGPLAVDALTVNAYLGSDGIEPFLSRCERNGCGIFVLVKTSNPSSGEFQDLEVDGTPLYERVARAVHAWGGQPNARGYTHVGAVVGATYPAQLAALRESMPHALFLVPGYGAQGGTADDVVPAFDIETGYGALINSSRQIMYAYEAANGAGEPYTVAQAAAAKAARDAICSALDRARRLRTGRHEEEKA